MEVVCVNDIIKSFEDEGYITTTIVIGTIAEGGDIQVRVATDALDKLSGSVSIEKIAEMDPAAFSGEVPHALILAIALTYLLGNDTEFSAAVLARFISLFSAKEFLEGVSVN